MSIFLSNLPQEMGESNNNKIMNANLNSIQLKTSIFLISLTTTNTEKKKIWDETGRGKNFSMVASNAQK